MADEPGMDALEEELRQLAAAREPVPPELMAAAADAFGWRDIDAELAALVYDSMAESGDAALVRGAADQRLFTFRAGDLVIDLEVTRDGQAFRMLGQVTPAQECSVDLRRPETVVPVTADDLGRFQAGQLAPGPLSLRLQLAAAESAVVTDWISI